MPLKILIFEQFLADKVAENRFWHFWKFQKFVNWPSPNQSTLVKHSGFFAPHYQISRFLMQSNFHIFGSQKAIVLFLSLIRDTKRTIIIKQAGFLWVWLVLMFNECISGK